MQKEMCCKWSSVLEMACDVFAGDFMINSAQNIFPLKIICSFSLRLAAFIYGFHLNKDKDIKQKQLNLIYTKDHKMKQKKQRCLFLLKIGGWSKSSPMWKDKHNYWFFFFFPMAGKHTKNICNTKELIVMQCLANSYDSNHFETITMSKMCPQYNNLRRCFIISSNDLADLYKYSDSYRH